MKNQKGLLKIFIFLVSAFALQFSEVHAQILNPVKWSSSYTHLGGEEFELVFKASIKPGWAVYSQFLDSDDGPVPTTLNYDDESHFSLSGKAIEEGGRKAGFDPIFEMDVVKFEKTLTIRQKVKLKASNNKISGYLNFMTCDDTQCLPPTDYDFSFELKKSEKPDGSETGAINQTTETSSIASAEIQIQLPEDDEDEIWEEDEGMLNPVKWIGSIKKIDNLTFEISFKAQMESGWHIYSQKIEGDDGPVPTSFVIDDPNNIIMSLGAFMESGPNVKKEYDEFFDMMITKIKGSGSFVTEIKLTEIPRSGLSGYLEYMACDISRCLPPQLFVFEVDFINMEVFIEGQDGDKLKAGVTRGEGTPVFVEFDYDQANSSCDNSGADEEERSSYFWIFILGFGGGLLAILTPCVFPMIPLTVSFFTKSSKDRASGIKNAVWYGFSIIVIYLVLGLLITGIFGADALNLLSTNAWFNIFFAILFIVFAISFFGYFEITLPASWVNSADQASDKGGMLGIFFMAFTLSLVSFSCTGPIIGTLLVETATGGGEVIMGRIPVAPLVGMFGFALALALPFALFAAFPGWLNSLPRSGGWMNSIKVTLGFVEIALALKFLSIADLTMGWKILPYEVFVFLWVLCAVGLAAYYFGLIRFPHDSPVKDISNLRKGLGISMLAFAVYLSLGFRYSEQAGTFATPNLLSGLAPPAGHSYIYPNSCPLNLNCYKDYYEGIEVAKRLNKPVLIDFTGHGCVNCRRMEDQVWSQDGIFDLLKDKYVIISLYVDERKSLDEPYISAFSGREMKTVGNKWADFQAIHFNRNSQPYYVLADYDGKVLNRPVAYTPDAAEYRAFLECGLERFKNRNQ